MMQLSSLSDIVTKGYEDLGIFSQIRGNSVLISEEGTGKNVTLKKFELTDLPNNGNFWKYRAEIQNIDCFRNQNKTVEDIIVYINGDSCFVFMVELKSATSKGNIKGLQSKFACSLVNFTNFIASNKNFNKLKLKLIPIGIMAFNDNYYRYTTDKKDIDERARLHNIFWNFDFSINAIQATSIQLKPPTLNRMQIDLVFCQNPAWIIEKSDSYSFSVNFNDLVKRLGY